jgi:hypothetical protein
MANHRLRAPHRQGGGRALRLAQLELQGLVDELGTVRAELKQLTALEQALTAQLKQELHANGVTALQGDRYEVFLVQSERLKIAPEGFFQLVSLEAFLQTVEVIPTRAREWVGERTLRELAEVIPVETLQVRERRMAA